MSKKRVSAAIDQADYEVLSRLSKLNGESMASIVGQLVHSVAPALSRVADVLEVASTAQGDVLKNLQRSVDESEALLSPLVLAGSEGFEEATSAMLDAVRPPAK